MLRGGTTQVNWDYLWNPLTQPYPSYKWWKRHFLTKFGIFQPDSSLNSSELKWIVFSQQCAQNKWSALSIIHLNLRSGTPFTILSVYETPALQAVFIFLSHSSFFSSSHSHYYREICLARKLPPVPLRDLPKTAASILAYAICHYLLEMESNINEDVVQASKWSPWYQKTTPKTINKTLSVSLMSQYVSPEKTETPSPKQSDVHI